MSKKNITKSSKDFNVDDKFNNLARQNEELIGEVRLLTKKIKQYLLFTQVMTILKVIFIVVPIILAVIYLPPMLKNFLAPYQNLLNPNSLGGINSYLPK